MFYVLKKGKKVQIFDNFEECQEYMLEYNCNKYIEFNRKKDAKKYIESYNTVQNGNLHFPFKKIDKKKKENIFTRFNFKPLNKENVTIKPKLILFKKNNIIDDDNDDNDDNNDNNKKINNINSINDKKINKKINDNKINDNKINKIDPNFRKKYISDSEEEKEDYDDFINKKDISKRNEQLKLDSMFKEINNEKIIKEIKNLKDIQNDLNKKLIELEKKIK